MVSSGNCYARLHCNAKCLKPSVKRSVAVVSKIKVLQPIIIITVMQERMTSNARALKTD